jgi:hypothetical protein
VSHTQGSDVPQPVCPRHTSYIACWFPPTSTLAVSFVITINAELAYHAFGSKPRWKCANFSASKVNFYKKTYLQLLVSMVSSNLPRGCSSAGRARQSHCRGQGFEPPHLHHSVICIISPLLSLKSALQIAKGCGIVYVTINVYTFATSRSSRSHFMQRVAAWCKATQLDRTRL